MKKIKPAPPEAWVGTRVFSVSPILHAVLLLLTLLVVLFAAAAIMLEHGQVFWIGVLFFSCMLAVGILSVRNTKVVVTNHEIVYKGLACSWRLRLENIRRIYIINIHLVLEYGGLSRKVIPLVFKNNSELLELISVRINDPSETSNRASS